MSRTLVIALALLTSMLSWAGESAPTSIEDAKLAQLITEGVKLAAARKPLDSITYFDQVISAYEETYRGEEAKLYCARWPTESLMYLLEAANAKIPAKIVSPNWAYAYYLKAYSLIELGRVSEAKELLGKAIAFSPHNSQFLSELASIYQGEKDWSKAQETFQAAEKAAQEFSPLAVKNTELSRAWRGLGFVYVEQNKLSEAENMYHQCLELNAADSKALNELRYIQRQRDKLGNQ